MNKHVMLLVPPLLHMFFRGQVIFFLEADIRGRMAAADPDLPDDPGAPEILEKKDEKG